MTIAKSSKINQETYFEKLQFDNISLFQMKTRLKTLVPYFDLHPNYIFSISSKSFILLEMLLISFICRFEINSKNLLVIRRV